MFKKGDRVLVKAITQTSYRELGQFRNHVELVHSPPERWNGTKKSLWRIYTGGYYGLVIGKTHRDIGYHVRGGYEEGPNSFEMEKRFYGYAVEPIGDERYRKPDFALEGDLEPIDE